MQNHVVKITASVVMVNFREREDTFQTSRWRATLDVGDEIIEGFFERTRDPLGDIQFHRQLLKKPWLGIVLANTGKPGLKVSDAYVRLCRDGAVETAELGSCLQPSGAPAVFRREHQQPLEMGLAC